MRQYCSAINFIDTLIAVGVNKQFRMAYGLF